MNSIANAVVFQLAWFAAVIGAGHGHAWPGVAAVAAFALLQLGTTPATRAADLKLIVLAAAIGFGLDSLFVSSGLLTYRGAWPSASLAPAWIVALWVNLALCLNHSLRWLQPRPWLAATLGAVASFTSYLGAARGWQAVAFAAPAALTHAIVAACWALALPLLCVAARRWTRAAAPAHLIDLKESTP